MYYLIIIVRIMYVKIHFYKYLYQTNLWSVSDRGIEDH